MIVEVSDEMRLDRGSIPLISIDKQKALLGKYEVRPKSETLLGLYYV